MSDPSVLELTASEPLSLEEEYEMQVTWSQDEDKRTFILIERELMENKSEKDGIPDDGFLLNTKLVINERKSSQCVHSKNQLNAEQSEMSSECDCLQLASQALINTNAAIGDINFFLSESLQYSDVEDEDEDGNITESTIQHPFTAEVEVMIAEISRRRRGLGHKAMKLLMNYGRTQLGVKRFIAKVLSHNEASLRLFERLGYSVKCIVECFDEIHYQYLEDSPNKSS